MIKGRLKNLSDGLFQNGCFVYMAKQLDDYANEMKKKYGGDANMNAEFNRCPT